MKSLLLVLLIVGVLLVAATLFLNSRDEPVCLHEQQVCYR